MNSNQPTADRSGDNRPVPRQPAAQKPGSSGKAAASSVQNPVKRTAAAGGTAVNLVKRTANAGESTANPVKRSVTAGAGANPVKRTANAGGTAVSPVKRPLNAGESTANPVKRSVTAGIGANPVKRTANAGGSAANPVKRSANASGTAASPVKRTANTGGSAANPVKRPANTDGTAAAKKPASSGGKKRKRSKRQARRIRRIRIACACIAVVALIAFAAFRLTTATVGGKVYPRSAQAIDLRGQGITDVRGLARMTNLREALLSGNLITDASPLAALTGCEYIDLTGNPVTAESYAYLREALPSCLILCEAGDYTTPELTLGGYELPDAEALARVIGAHRGLKLVDLRGAELTDAEAAELQAQFPHITFVSPSAQTAGTTVVNLGSAAEAVNALARMESDAHVTVTGCSFAPEEYRALTEQYPGMTLDCLIAAGGVTIPSTAEEADLSGCAADEINEETLRLWKNLKKVTLPETLPSEAARIKAGLMLEEVNFTYCGAFISPAADKIDLSAGAQPDASELEALLDAHPQITSVRLGTPDAALLSVAAARSGSVRFDYEVEAFGRTFSTADEIIDFGDSIDDDDVAGLTNLISQLPNLKEAHMYESTLSQESMDLLFDSFPDVFFGWTFRMCKGKYVVRTDITAFCTQLGAPLHEFTQEDFEQLRYCRNMLALDLCHNAITDVSFLRSFPKLKLLIIGDNQLTDISPLADLKELEFLEIFMNYDITDYSPLSGLQLTDLNVRCPGGKRGRLKADAFLNMTTLERFWASSGHMSDEEQDRIRKALPDCEISITKDHSTGDDWRGGGRQEVIERMFDTRVYEPLP